MLQQVNDLTGIASGIGALGLLSWLVFRIMRQSSNDRKEYRDSLAKERKNNEERLKVEREAHEKKVQDITEANDSQIQDLRQQVITLKAELATLQEQFEQERTLRHRAEDAAARYRRMAGVTDDEQI